jgi:glutamate-1-semialdehyde 2,1-aminomutase
MADVHPIDLNASRGAADLGPPTDDPVAAALDDARARYADRRPRSAEQARAAVQVLPAGSTRSVLDFAPYPFRVARADGATLVDVDGHAYLDLLGDYTAGLLGHNPPAVADAVRGVLDRGWSLGAVAEDEHRLAQLLCSRFPSIEQIRFTNSGTEANLMAINLARHLTGRNRVAVFDGAYHGGLLYFGAAGGPLQAPFDYVHCRYNDIESVASALDRYGDDVACLLVEPMMGSGGCIPAEPGFLAGLRELCTATGVQLIFDEVMTSRMAAGGAQERTGVTPDMTTLGKYLGGGMTFGAFGGSASAMGAFDPARGGALTHGGTFNNNAVTMRAGVAAVEALLSAEALERLFDRGETLRADIGPILARGGMSATGWGSLIGLHPVPGPVRGPADLADGDSRRTELIFHELLDRGVYIAPRGFIALSLAVSDTDLDRFVEALSDSVEVLLRRGALLG